MKDWQVDDALHAASHKSPVTTLPKYFKDAELIPGVVMSPLMPLTFCFTQKAPCGCGGVGCGGAGGGALHDLNTCAVYVSLKPSLPGSGNF